MAKTPEPAGLPLMTAADMARAMGTDAFDEWEERAAIMEFDGGMDRATAEAAAYTDVSKRWQADAKRGRRKRPRARAE